MRSTTWRRNLQIAQSNDALTGYNGKSAHLIAQLDTQEALRAALNNVKTGKGGFDDMSKILERILRPKNRNHASPNALLLYATKEEYHKTS